MRIPQKRGLSGDLFETKRTDIKMIGILKHNMRILLGFSELHEEC